MITCYQVAQYIQDEEKINDGQTDKQTKENTTKFKTIRTQISNTTKQNRETKTKDIEKTKEGNFSKKHEKTKDIEKTKEGKFSKKHEKTKDVEKPEKHKKKKYPYKNKGETIIPADLPKKMDICVLQTNTKAKRDSQQNVQYITFSAIDLSVNTYKFHRPILDQMQETMENCGEKDLNLELENLMLNYIKPIIHTKSRLNGKSYIYLSQKNNCGFFPNLSNFFDLCQAKDIRQATIDLLEMCILEFPSNKEINDALHWPTMLQNMMKQKQDESHHLVKYYFYFYCAVQEIRSNHVVHGNDLMKNRFEQTVSIKAIRDFYSTQYQKQINNYLLHKAGVTPNSIHAKWTNLTKPIMRENAQKRKFHPFDYIPTNKKQKIDKI